MSLGLCLSICIMRYSSKYKRKIEMSINKGSHSYSKDRLYPAVKLSEPESVDFELNLNVKMCKNPEEPLDNTESKPVQGQGANLRTPKPRKQKTHQVKDKNELDLDNLDKELTKYETQRLGLPVKHNSD